MWKQGASEGERKIGYFGITDICIYPLRGREYMFIEGRMNSVAGTRHSGTL